MKKNTKKAYNRRLYAIVIFLLMVIGISACKQEQEDKASVESNSKSYMITSDNYFGYQSGMECAGFASAFVLRAFGEEAEGQELFERLPNKAPDGGIMPYGIAAFFNEYGYQAEYVCNGTLEDLKEQVDLGVPVIVFIHVSEPVKSIHNTHYVPVVGYDEEYLYIAESIPELANCIDEKDAAYNRKIENAQFMTLWENIDGMWDYPYFKISQSAE